MGSKSGSKGKATPPVSDPTKFFGNFLYHTLFPLCLISLCPFFTVAIIYTNRSLDGSLLALANLFLTEGPIGAVKIFWPTPSPTAWKILISFVSFEAFLQLTVPGKVHRGPITATGHIPTYIGNGVQCFSITMATLFAIHHFNLFPLASIYDLFGELISTSCIFSLFFCAFLVFKGIFFPSSTDNQVSGNPIFDYYWGVELYPRFGKLDLKTLINCRVGMMSWPILLICYLIKQQELYGEVSNTMYISVGVQMVYLTKFYIWETGYFDSIDIMHDRFGFYICWGCLTWLPSLYTNCTYYLVNHPINLPTNVAYALFVAGVLAVYINYSIDEQRQRFRATKGNTTIWGKKPQFLKAPFKTDKGETKESLILISGWWGVSRHFNYVAELAAALLWCPPVQTTHLLPYGYFIFLTILLVHRSLRDEIRCANKYGKVYEEYRAKVPSKMIPGIF